MTFPSSLLAGGDPYDGQPTHAPVYGPWPASVVLSEAWSEPMWLRTVDPGSGFALSTEPAPPLACARCGAQTSRTRILAVTVELNPAGGERLLAPQLEAECPRCAKARAGVGLTAADLTGVPRALQAPEPHMPWEVQP